MEAILKEKLWTYIIDHNPDLMYDLQEEYRVTDYLDEKVASIIRDVEDLMDKDLPFATIQEICVERMTVELRPSKFLFVRDIIKIEFPLAYEAMTESGMLTYEVINLIRFCEKIFDKYGFSEHTVHDKKLRAAIVGEVDFYLS